MTSSATMSSAGRSSSMANSSSHASMPNTVPASRPRGPAATNGVNKTRSHNDSKAGGSLLKESNTPDKHSHDRLVFLLANFVGRVATVTVKTGHQFIGIFSGSSLGNSDSRYVLRMTRKLQNDVSSTDNGANIQQEPVEEYVGYGDDHVMTFDVKEVVDLCVADVTLDTVVTKLSNGVSSGFKTDTDISGNGSIRERELHRWEPSSDVAVDLSLSGNSGATWDQFEANERLYGVRADYNENVYTTAIDRSHPSYTQRLAAAEKLAREIESGTTTNPHMAEERGQINERDGTQDEEDKYSGVRRDLLPLIPTQNRYTPPARRAPTGHTTVSGAPVDPAIISAQLVRPDSSTVRSAKSQAPTISGDSESQLKENIAPVVESVDSAPALPASESDSLQQTKPTAALRQAESSRDESLPQPESKGAIKLNAAAKSALPPVITVNNGTTNVESKVLNDFKEFVSQERLRVAERGREQARNQARKDFESKVHDLKKFASNFKLKSVVPEDMLGILAKDKHKQIEIIEKSQREQKEAVQAKLTSPVNAAESPTSTRPEATSSPPLVEKQQSRASQSGGTAAKAAQGAPTSSRLAPGQLGQRLMAQPQYRDRTTATNNHQLQTSEQSTSSAAHSTRNAEHVSSRSGSIASPTAAAMSRFNVQAMEFKPNPAASAFSPRPSRDDGVPSPLATKPPAHSRPPVKADFFSNRRPRAAGDRLSLFQSFNPIVRMKKEETEKDSKKFESNGGIPQAYRTLPTWQVADGNKEKSYVDMFEKIVPVVAVVPGTMAHQQQLQAHLQPGHHVLPQVAGPQQQPHQPQQHFVQGREHHFDDHRMHASASTSSVFPSPRFQQPMLAFQPSPMLGQMQPGFVQPVSQYAMSHNGPIPQVRQFPGGQQFQGPHLTSAPMMVNHSSGGSFMNIPVQQMPVYSPGQNGVFPTHINGPPNGFSSPRMAPPMLHQGSQQGQGSQPYMYLNPQQVFVQPHPAHMQQLRGGMPMMGQNFPSSSHLQQHFHPHRGNSYASNFNAQHAGPNQNAQHHQMQPQNSQAAHPDIPREQVIRTPHNIHMR